VGSRTRGGVIFAWIAANILSYESVRVLDSLPFVGDVAYLGDATFVQGSGAPGRRA